MNKPMIIFGMLLWSLLVGGIAAKEPDKRLHLVVDGKSNTVIVYPDFPKGAELDRKYNDFAVKWLQEYVYKASGAKIESMTESKLAENKAAIISIF